MWRGVFFHEQFRGALAPCPLGNRLTRKMQEWLEQQFGEGTVRKINETLRTESYHKKHFWTGLFGSDVETLWQDYKKALKKN